MHWLLAEEREGDLGSSNSSNSSNLGQSPGFLYVHEMKTGMEDNQKLFHCTKSPSSG